MSNSCTALSTPNTKIVYYQQVFIFKLLGYKELSWITESVIILAARQTAKEINMQINQPTVGDAFIWMYWNSRKNRVNIATKDSNLCENNFSLFKSGAQSWFGVTALLCRGQINNMGQTNKQTNNTEEAVRGDLRAAMAETQISLQCLRFTLRGEVWVCVSVCVHLCVHLDASTQRGHELPASKEPSLSHPVFHIPLSSVKINK